MMETRVFQTPDGFVRALGRDTEATVRAWDKLVATIQIAPRVMRGAVPDESPNIRRFHIACPWDQRLRGICVGANVTATLMTRLRIPDDASPTSGTPKPLIKLSMLYTYDISRMEAQNEGINLGNTPGPQGDGSIGSCAFKAAAVLGTVKFEDYDSSPQAIDSHRNGTIPPNDVQGKGKTHVVQQFAICDSFDHALEMLGAGFPLSFNSPIPEGMMHTDNTGFFRMNGRIVGGHSFQCLDFSKKLNRIWIGQAWSRWGQPSQDPAYAPMAGYTQIGTCPLDEMEKFFAPNMISSGQSEICVANTVQSWDAPILDYSVM